MAQGRSRIVTLHDRDWRGYNVRAMMPLVALAGVFSLLDLLGRWFVADLSRFAEEVGSLVLFLPVVLMWSVVVALLLYRTITYTYRLTDRAILVDRGFRWPPESPVWLSDIQEVRAKYSTLGRCLGVGGVDILAVSGRTVKLTGVRDPLGFADAIQKQMEQTKAIAAHENN